LSSDSDAHTSGTAGDAPAWGLQQPEAAAEAAGGVRRRSTRVKYRARRNTAAAE
jgi:hypothetical protein